jgi:hypothetical protein
MNAGAASGDVKAHALGPAEKKETGAHKCASRCGKPRPAGIARGLGMRWQAPESHAIRGAR